MRLHPLVAVYNESTVLTDTDVQNYLTVLKYASDHHFEPHWNATGSFVFVPKGGTKPTGDDVWEAHILDTSDQAGALGYHYDDNGMPIMRTFAKTDKQYGLSWQVTFSHEWWEALGDAWCLLASQDPNANKFYGYEFGDPVEGDQFAYTSTHLGLTAEISDFVLPGWFTGDAALGYDYKGHCTSAFQVLQDGYASIYISGSWTTYQNQNGDLRPVNAADDADQPRIRNRNKRRDHLKNVHSSSN